MELGFCLYFGEILVIIQLTLMGNVVCSPEMMYVEENELVFEVYRPLQQWITL